VFDAQIIVRTCRLRIRAVSGFKQGRDFANWLVSSLGRSQPAIAPSSAGSPSAANKYLRPPRSDYDLKTGMAVREGARHAATGRRSSADRGAAGGPSVILIQRPETMTAHPGQISFLGGKVDAADPSPVETALTEAEE
jgi:hypothetical protein